MLCLPRKLGQILHARLQAHQIDGSSWRNALAAPSEMVGHAPEIGAAGAALKLERLLGQRRERGVRGVVGPCQNTCPTRKKRRKISDELSAFAATGWGIRAAKTGRRIHSR